MADISPNMGLTKWTSSADYFSHAQLADNLQLIDQHDHTAGKGVQIPAGGLAASAVGSSTIAGGAITASHLGAGSVTANALANNAVTNVKILDDQIQYTKIAKDGGGSPGAFSATATGFTATSGADTAVGAVTWTPDFNLSGWFSTSTGRFTPLVRGIYFIQASVLFSATTDTGQYSPSIYLNTTNIRSQITRMSGTGSARVTVGMLAKVNGSSDYFQCGYFAATAVTVTPSFQGYLVARTTT